jgi:hypothetical protein
MCEAGPEIILTAHFHTHSIYEQSSATRALPLPIKFQDRYAWFQSSSAVVRIGGYFIVDVGDERLAEARRGT